ncbi:GTPase, partial [Arthrospira platensis SPKY1]|nr:GTPase [Arthrospira platensis SPKY1]
MLPIGPVVIIDTAGLDDEGELGRQRVEKSFEVLRKCHLVIFVCDAELGKEAFGDLEEQFIWQLQKRKINCIVALNKCGNLPDMAKKARATDIIALAEDLKRTSDIGSLKEELRAAGRIR